MIITLEGADQCGKTHLSNILIKEFNAFYIHNSVLKDITVRDDIVSKFEEISLLKEKGRSVVIDRSWLSNYIYSQVFKQDYLFSKEDIKFIEDIVDLNIYCCPSDYKFELNRDEMYDEVDKVMKVKKLYDDFIFSPNFFTFEDIFKRKCVVYDYKKDSITKILKR